MGRDHPEVGIKPFINSIYTHVVVGGGTCVVSGTRSIANTTNSGVAVVLICFANVVGGGRSGVCSGNGSRIRRVNVWAVSVRAVPVRGMAMGRRGWGWGCCYSCCFCCC